jgi:hypothetical protein
MPEYPGATFSAWFEIQLGCGRHAVDARYDTLCIGRILIGTGRDGTDVATSTTFGPTGL